MRWLTCLCILSLATSGSLIAQGTGTVSGMVTGSDAQPLAGAVVAITGVNLGAQTGPDGRFTITAVPSGSRTIRATFAGYQEGTRVVTVSAGQTAVANIELSQQAIQLEGVVAVGYGTARRRDVTGSVSSVDLEDAGSAVVANVSQALSGRVAGVQTTVASAEPGGGMSIRIRGTGSINASNEPLYVIDGLPIDNTSATPTMDAFSSMAPRNPLNALSPDDILSVEVLKDASATAIYGARGANGVVLITTKSGQQGSIAVDYEGSVGYQQVVRELDILSAPEYMALLNDLRRDMGQAPEFSAEQIAAIGQGTNWQSEVTRGAPVTNHHLSLSGGSENSRFYAGLNMFDQEGVVVSSGTRRYSGRVNVEQTLSSLKLGLNLNTSFVNDDNVPLGTGVNEGGGIIQAGLFQDPTLSTRIIDGHYEFSPFVNVENPLGLAYGINDLARTNRTFGNAFAEYTGIPGVTARLNLGTDRQVSRRESYANRLSKRGSDNNGISDVRSNERYSDLGELTVNYARDVGASSRFDVLAGTTYQLFTQTSLSAGANDFISDGFQFDNLEAGNRQTFEIGSGRARNELLSYLSRANYNLLDRYLLTATLRADGSSRFGADNKFGYFPSAALAWRVVDEPFLQNQTLFSDLKLRFSYGVTGNQEIGNYNSLVLFGSAGTAYFDESPFLGIAPTQIANPDLQWETTTQFNAGVDFGVFDNRISGTLDYFTRNTTDLLLNLPIPATSGFNTMLQNIGAIRNHGWELGLSTDNLSGAIGWTSFLNVSAIRNEVTDLGGLPQILQGGLQFVNNVTRLKVGEPMNSYYGYVVDGVFQLTDDIAGSAQPLAQPGELRFRDLDGDGEITPDDRTVLGDPFADLTFGLTNAFTYGPFSLNVSAQGSWGNELLNLTTVEFENPVSFRRNRLRESYTDRWTPDNPTNDNPSGLPVRVVYGGPMNSRTVEDASYLRVRNLSLQYTLPPDRFGLRSSSVFVSVDNLWTLTNYSGYDPDVTSFGGSNVRADYSAYPASRTITAGVRMGL